MKKEIQESITFLINEFKRLKKLDEIGKLSKEEKEQLQKLASFLTKDKIMLHPSSLFPSKVSITVENLY